MQNLSNYLDFAIETAWQAGRLTLGYYQQAALNLDWKGDDTPVTVADREAEKLIRQRIETMYPHHGIVGEEFGLMETAGAEHRWYIDPIDGTRSFMRGVPLYGVLLGLEIAGRVEVGVAYFPALDEMLAAATGQGCRWNGRRCHVSAENSLSRALIAHANTRSFAKVSPAKGEAWTRLSQKSQYNAGWCDAYAYLLVATGRAEVALDPIMNVWDCAPFPPIFREAGGYFGDWRGEETIHGGEAVATNHALLPAVLAELVG